MSDKDRLERDVLRSFPSSRLLICVFHTLRTFKRKVSCAKLNIKPNERDSALELLQKMVDAKSEAMFEELEAQFDSAAPAPVTAYYNKNWRSVRQEWFTGPQFLMNSSNNTTNHRLEAINGKLKSVIKPHSVAGRVCARTFCCPARIG
ncbi:hypothetical protein HPB48_011218 [Haemaphysalis longicornis]|uniref:MULE transposase domain-containing protein n=1 Tax=Haemaphysalis longicornis TaxID=44386 RepID=A0A9J6G7M9_HAELO|nr:hypothetical protein HPB48_011218 [Haemaphysalis longicornis]